MTSQPLRNPKRGTTLVELMFGLGLLALLMVVMAVALRNGQSIWRQVSGSTDTTQQLVAASSRLRRDLLATSRSQIGTCTVASHLPTGGYAGSAVWFLSAVGPDGKFYRSPSDGTPLWQSNILYYAAVPNNYAQTFGTGCAGHVGPMGYDDGCPQKVLIRVVIGSPTPITSEAAEATLMTPHAILPYLKRPNGFSVHNMEAGNANVRSVQIEGRQLTWFYVKLLAAPEQLVKIDMRATNLLRARKTLAVGSVGLYSSPLTSDFNLEILPNTP